MMIRSKCSRIVVGQREHALTTVKCLFIKYVTAFFLRVVSVEGGFRVFKFKASLPYKIELLKVVTTLLQHPQLISL